MNNYSALLQQALGELNTWLLQKQNAPSNDMQFYEGLKNLLTEALDSDPQKVDGIVKTILHMIADSGPDEVFEKAFYLHFIKLRLKFKVRKKVNQLYLKYSFLSVSDFQNSLNSLVKSFGKFGSGWFVKFRFVAKSFFF